MPKSVEWSKISHDDLLALVRYDPDTGEFTFIKAPGNRTDMVGRRAGRTSIRDDGSKVRTIKLQQRDYIESRVAWFYMTGSWPTVEIDHKDTDPLNNKWSNLREATSSQNKWNQKSKGGISPYKGVIRLGKRWKAHIRVDYKRKSIGVFDSEIEAAAAYDREARVLHGEYARLNFPDNCYA
jgi:HNH endonuclease